MNSYYVYIISNIKNTVLYIWVTNNLIKRIYEHKNKIFEWFTKKYNVDKLVYYEVYNDVNVAIDREKKLKKWNRKWKDELIDTTNKDRIDLYDVIIDK